MVVPAEKVEKLVLKNGDTKIVATVKYDESIVYKKVFNGKECDTISAPVSHGQRVGTVTFSYNGIEIATVDAVVKDGIEEDAVLSMMGKIKNFLFGKFMMTLLIIIGVIIVVYIIVVIVAICAGISDFITVIAGFTKHFVRIFIAVRRPRVGLLALINFFAINDENILVCFCAITIFIFFTGGGSVLFDSVTPITLVNGISVGAVILPFPVTVGVAVEIGYSIAYIATVFFNVTTAHT